MNGGGCRVENIFQVERRTAVQRPEGKVNGLEQREEGKHARGEAGLVAETGVLCLPSQVKSLD